MGFSEDDPWERVLRLFEEGGKYAGRWGWLETLRRAEVGDQISIKWAENAFPDSHPALDKPLSFGLDSTGNLILTGDGFFVGHEIAGLFGHTFNLAHYTDLTASLCSPYQCGYVTNFSTSSIHVPYLHQKIKWEEFANPIAVIDIAKMAGSTVFVGGMTVTGVGLVLATCTTLIGCIAGIAVVGPATGMEAIATYYLFQGTFQVFRHEFIETTP